MNIRISTGVSTNTHIGRSTGLRSMSRLAPIPAAQARVTNSYMLPHGARSVATPRNVIDVRCSPQPRMMRLTPIRPSRSRRDRRGASMTRPGIPVWVGEPPAPTRIISPSVGRSVLGRVAAKWATSRVSASRYTANADPNARSL